MRDPAGTEAEYDLAGRDVLQRHDLLGGPGGIAQREDHHAEAELDALGDACRGREHDHAVRIRAGRLEVVADEDAVEAEPLGCRACSGVSAALPSAPACSITPIFSRRLTSSPAVAVEVQDLHAGGR